MENPIDPICAAKNQHMRLGVSHDDHNPEVNNQLLMHLSGVDGATITMPGMFYLVLGHVGRFHADSA